MNSVTLVVFHLLLATAFRFSSAAGCPGCSSPVSDPNSKDIRDVISSTLRRTNAGYDLTNVKQCTSQVVAGIKYDCQIEIKSPSGEVSTCRLAVVQRPWLKENKEEIVADTCSSLTRAKREICGGCPNEVDANSSEMKKQLSDVLSQTNSGLTLVKGTRCTAQVVAGFKYDCTIQVESPQTNGVQTCQLVFVEQGWKTPATVVLKDTCSPLVTKEKALCVGCPGEIDANTPEMKKRLNGVLSQTNSGLTLVKGTHCTAQVVAGFKYDCTIQVESPKTNGVQTCKLVFVHQAWKTPSTFIIKDTCSSLVRSKREVCAGCPEEVDANSSDMKNKLTGVLGQTNSGLTLVKGTHCTSQVVAGIKYDCKIQVESPKTNGVRTCHLVFVDQPWETPATAVLKDTCSQLVRNKREICDGCPEEIDANSSEMKKTLTGVLGQTNSDLTLVKGTRCTSQVVAGIKYDCTIQVESPKTNGVQTCKLVFVDQPWLTPKVAIMTDTCSQLVRNKRELCTGCPKEEDANTPEMRDTLNGILSQTNSGLTLVKGKSCTTQVVSGIKTTCTLEVTSPKINGVQTCTISFLEQPWMNPEPEILADSCSQLTRSKREVCAGCPVEQDPHDPEMEKKMSSALSQTNSGLGLVAVQKCTTQVVAGVLYDCTIRVNSPHFNGVETCELKVLEQPWISKTPQVVSDTCSQLNNRA